MPEVPFNDLSRCQNEVNEHLQKQFADVLNSVNFILGQRLIEFEKLFANYCQTRYAIGTASGLDALIFSLKALGISKNDEVIVPDYGFSATALSVLHAGAIPVFADVSNNFPLINAKTILPLISEKTKAVIVVHMHGLVCEMDEIQDLCSSYDLCLLEDFAQSHGATWKRKMTGSFGKINATSFYPAKNLGALGDGGAVTTSDEYLMDQIRLYRNYGSTDRINSTTIGYNSRLDEIQAAFLSVKLDFLEKWNSERRTIASFYKERMSEQSEVYIPEPHLESKPVYHIFSIYTKRKMGLYDYLRNKGIECRMHYKLPMHCHDLFKHYIKPGQTFKNSVQLSSDQLSLPCFPGLKIEEIDYICQQINNFFRC
ncbi:MAG: DegT/DnrJ/EryC1/StrS family aminotransferase [Cyclobacteriaceae bacterium]|nr:DegT/DnrJ/EryC1/StrS family aminotransferase [Cyclobacteriaceae bacterium]